MRQRHIGALIGLAMLAGCGGKAADSKESGGPPDITADMLSPTRPTAIENMSIECVYKPTDTFTATYTMAVVDGRMKAWFPSEQIAQDFCVFDEANCVFGWQGDKAVTAHDTYDGRRSVQVFDLDAMTFDGYLDGKDGSEPARKTGQCTSSPLPAGVTVR